ncbi:MAG TPA: ricin-type beta-trefoil lectin domain protein [Actinocrinis sp.]|nr:ricin-type beta-trefoil lectin domain protein [Actinocrinis sp.]
MTRVRLRTSRYPLLIGLFALLGSLTLATGASASAPVAAAATPAISTTISANGASTGRTFDGVGAISGGGGNSRLLTDYPAAQQSQILDYMFKPDYGANLQILKVEIGGDANSTDGAEPSIEHTSGNVQCNTGYEFWLMEQAKARNPNIKLYGLAWAAPGWIGGGNFWSTDMINYLVSWLGCAKADGLTINYLGGWNERDYNIAWYEQLRSTLNNDGYSAVQIVGADSTWSVADDMASNSAFNNAIQVVGSHYPCQGGDGGNADTCSTTSNALSLNKPLWASENGSQDMTTGSPALIRSIIRGYTDAQLTAYLNWPLLAAITPNLPYPTDGMITAPQPWSGEYSVGESTWATAQVTQFAQPGWKFLNNNSGSGYLGGSESNGSYVTLKSTNNTDYSTIIETTTATAAQTVTENVSGGLSTGTVHVWSTDVNSPSSATDFVHSQDITPSNGSYTLTLQPGYIYSITTTTGQGKGTAASPASSALALPYSDSFDQDATGSEAKYLADMQGAYQVEPCSAGRSGQCVQQMAPIKPIEWQSDSDAYALLGDTTWSNYTVSVDVDMQQAGTVTLLGRANTQSRPQSAQAAYQLRLSNSGAWSIAKNDTSSNLTTLISGTHAGLNLNSWHTITLGFSGNTITATLDGATLGTTTDTSYTTGQVGLGVVGYQTDQFDNLKITANPAGNLGGVIKGLQSGKCVDVPASSQTNGALPALWDCTGGANQFWTATPAKQLTVYGTAKCLDAANAGTTDGTPVEIWDCNGGGNQQWTINANGSIVGVASGKCLDATGAATANGTGLELWDCNGGSNQDWARGNITSTLVGGASGRCIDVPAGNQTNGTRPALWECSGASNQEWSSTATNQLQVFGTKCLDIVGGTADGAAVDIWDCNGGSNQQWDVQSNGTVINPASGKCLDAINAGTTDNTQLEIWDCNGGGNQVWNRGS